MATTERNGRIARYAVAAIFGALFLSVTLAEAQTPDGGYSTLAEAQTPNGGYSTPAEAQTPDGGYPALVMLPPVPVPPDNPQTAAKIELGRMLFWDGRLSGDGSSPCAGCHFPQLGWGEGGRISRGYPGTKHWRNAQTVLNAAHYNKLFWDGAVASLEAQAQAAARGAIAGNGDAAMMEMRLRHVPDYVNRFREVFGTEWPRLSNAWQAIAAFERTLVSDPKKVALDRHLNGDYPALSPAALRGHALYHGKAGCIRCHNGALASNQKFYDIGVPESDLFRSSPLHQVTQRWQQYQKGVTEPEYRKAARDLGLYYVTKNPQDVGKFRVPSLRELKYTAPYMHNGAFASLREVLDFYDRGAGEGPNKTPLLQPLGLTAQEKGDLISFLDTLSMDQPLVVKVPRLPAYEALK